MYFSVNLKMEKPMLCCCFTWIVFIKLNFSCISVNKKNLGWPIYQYGGGWEILRNGGGGRGGGPLRTMVSIWNATLSWKRLNKLAMSQAWIDKLTWNCTIWYKFSKSKTWDENSRLGIVKNEPVFLGSCKHWVFYVDIVYVEIKF